MAGKLKQILNNKKPPVNLDPPKKKKLAGFKSIKAIPEAIPHLVKDIQHNVFAGNTGVGQSQFDKNIPLSQLENIQQLRAVRQPGSHKFIHAVGGGIVGGVLTGLENAGYILDIENNVNRLRGLETVDTNIFSQWAKDNKEAVYENLPIYRKDPNDTFDWDDSGFYWEMFRGALESAVGFGGVGIGAGLAVKGLGASIRAARLANWTNNVGKSLQGGTLGTIGATAITNFGESKMMGLELYEQSFEKNLNSMIEDYREKNNGAEPNSTQLKNMQLQASKISGEAADDFIMRNKAFALIEYSQLSSIFKATGLTRNLMDKPGWGSFLKSQAKNAPKEAAEEIGQNVLQMEGIFQTEQALRDEDIEVEDPISEAKSFGERFVEFGLSDQALLEGMMGFISGPIQYSITSLPFRNAAAETKTYTDQQATIQKNEEFIKNNLNVLSARTKVIEEQIKAGRDDLAKLNELQEFDKLAIENFTRGTTENLESTLQEELGSNEYTEEQKANIQEKLIRLDEMEQEYINYQKYSNAPAVLQNRVQLRQSNDALNALDTNTAEAEERLKESFSKLINTYNKSVSKEENKTSLDAVIDAIESNDLNSLPKPILNLIRDNIDAQTIMANSRSYDFIADNLDKLNSRYNDLTKSNYQMPFERLTDIMNDLELTTEQKAEQLGKLQDTIQLTDKQKAEQKDIPKDNKKRIKNDSLKELVDNTKAGLEEDVRKSKEKNEVKTDPDVERAKVKTENSKPKSKSKKLDLSGEPDPTGEIDSDEKLDLVSTDDLFAEDIPTDLQAELEKFKKGKIAKAMLEGAPQEVLDDISNMSNQDLRVQYETDVDEVTSAKAALEDWNKMSKDDKSINPDPSNGSTAYNIEGDRLVPANVITGSNNTKDENVELKSYKGQTSVINNDLQNNDRKLSDKKSSVDVKLNMVGGSPKFKEWALQGVDHTGTEVEYKLGRGFTEDNKRALELFNRRKSGEDLSRKDKEFIRDNLHITVNVSGIPGATTNLFHPRLVKGAEGSFTAEKLLRANIVANLLQDQPAVSTIKGQYGGNLILVDDDTTITEIPDFKDMPVEKIEFMYVTGEGKLNDADTRQPTRHSKFNGVKVLLKENKKPMAGALFTTVRKANGELFPLKLNIRSFNEGEKRAIVNMLVDIGRPQTGKTNTLNLPVSDAIMNKLNQEDRDFLGSNAKYKDVLGFLVYEGGRTRNEGNTNSAIQLFVNNGKIIFGSNSIDASDDLDIESKKSELYKFLDNYKNRSVDLRRLTSDPKYKRHIINSGVITTNTDTNVKHTLFGIKDIANVADEATKLKERFMSAAIYVDPNLKSKTAVTPSKKLEQIKSPTGVKTVSYTPKGKENQSYTIEGNKIFNSKGEEVFEKDGADRRKIFANLAVKEKRAVVITHKSKDYVVNKKGDIMSTVSGAIMKWSEDNGNRKAILTNPKVQSLLSGSLQTSQKEANLQKELPIIDNSSRINKIKDKVQDKIDNMNLPQVKPGDNINTDAASKRANKLAAKFKTNLNKINKENKEDNKDNCK